MIGMSLTRPNIKANVEDESLHPGLSKIENFIKARNDDSQNLPWFLVISFWCLFFCWLCYFQLLFDWSFFTKLSFSKANFFNRKCSILQFPNPFISKMTSRESRMTLKLQYLHFWKHFVTRLQKEAKKSLYFDGSFMYHCTALSVIIMKPKLKENVQFLQFPNSFISKMTTRECIMTLKVHYLHFENILLQGSRKKQEGLPILVVFTCTIPQHQCKDYETKANCSILI